MKTTLVIDTTKAFTASVSTIPQFELGEQHTLRIEATGLDTGCKLGLAAYTLAGDPLFAVHDMAWETGFAEASLGTSTVQAVAALGERQRMEIIVGVDEYTGTAPNQTRKTIAQFKTVLYRDSYAGSENPETIEQAVAAVATATAQAAIAIAAEAAVEGMLGEATTFDERLDTETAARIAGDEQLYDTISLLTGNVATKMDKIVAPEGNFVLANDPTGNAKPTTVTEGMLEANLPSAALAKLISAASSSCRLFGGEISDASGYCVRVEGGGGVVKTVSAALEDIPQAVADEQASPVQYVEWSATEVLLQDGYNIIFWDASAGAITSCLREDMASVFDFTRDFAVGSAYFDMTAGTNAFRLCGMDGWNFPRRVQMFGEERFPVERASGLMIGNPYGLQISLTAGVIWAGLVNRFPINGFNSNSGDTFTTWTRDASDGEPGAWISATVQQDMDPIHYNNPLVLGGLSELTANRYGVHWVYVVHDSSVHVVYGTGNYTLAQAQNATPPTILPGLIAAYATLVGKAIVKKNASTLTSIQSPFVTRLGLATVNEHNDLGGLQGGTSGKYYHLTSEQVSAVNGAVRHDTAQALSDAAKAQACANVGLSSPITPGMPPLPMSLGSNGAVQGNGVAFRNGNNTTTGGKLTYWNAYGIAPRLTEASAKAHWYHSVDATVGAIKLIFNSAVILDLAIVRSSGSYTVGGVAVPSNSPVISWTCTGTPPNIVCTAYCDGVQVGQATGLNVRPYILQVEISVQNAYGWLNYFPHLNYWTT